MLFGHSKINVTNTRKNSCFELWDDLVIYGSRGQILRKISIAFTSKWDQVLEHKVSVSKHLQNGFMQHAEMRVVEAGITTMLNIFFSFTNIVGLLALEYERISRNHSGVFKFSHSARTLKDRVLNLHVFSYQGCNIHAKQPAP